MFFSVINCNIKFFVPFIAIVYFVRCMTETRGFIVLGRVDKDRKGSQIQHPLFD